jgi:hypothetical protein
LGKLSCFFDKNSKIIKLIPFIAFVKNKFMKIPEFYNEVETIVLKDALSDFTGAFDNGIIAYSYLDMVKLAGHSCPTVAGAYLICRTALKHLYPDSMAQRGEIAIEFKNDAEDGATGVVSNLFSLITGATEKSGFKGLNGQFVRHSLMRYNASISGDYRFTRKDTGQSVELVYNPIPPSAQLKELMQKCLTQSATFDETKLFKDLWQERVRMILQSEAEVIRVL